MGKTLKKIKPEKVTDASASAEEKAVETGPRAGVFVVSPAQGKNLRIIRITSPIQARIFKDDIEKLWRLLVNKTGLSEQDSFSYLLYHLEASENPGILVLFAVDEMYRLKGYLLASVLPDRIRGKSTLFVCQVALNCRMVEILAEGYQRLKEYAKGMGCTTIEFWTKRDGKAFEKWAARFGFKRDMISFQGEVN